MYYYESGTWTDNTEISANLGQVVSIEVKNLNVLGTTISIQSNIGRVKATYYTAASNGKL